MPRPTRVVLFAIGIVAAGACGSAPLPSASAPEAPGTFFEPPASVIVASTAPRSSTPEAVGAIATVPPTGPSSPTATDRPTATTEVPPQVLPPIVPTSLSATTSSTAASPTTGTAREDGRFPYPTVYDVPQLGADPVRGTGCGLADSLGNEVPDGIWYGLLYPGSGSGSIGLDLVCAYYGVSALDQGAAPGLQEILYPVNGSDRVRQINRAGDFVVRQAVSTGAGCVDPGPSGDLATVPAGAASWVIVEGGEARLALAFCT